MKVFHNILTVLSANPWNSLEVTKLILTGLTPIIVVIIGLAINRKLKRFEHRQWRNQKLIEKRLSIYDDIAPCFNDLLCYFTYVGDWKKCEPAQIIKMKRVLDKKIYLAKAIFSDIFFTKAMAFMDICYKPYQGWGVDAKLLTTVERRKIAYGPDWNSDWEKLFTDNPNEIATSVQVRKAYDEVLNALSTDIGIQ